MWNPKKIKQMNQYTKQTDSQDTENKQGEGGREEQITNMGLRSILYLK